MCKWTGYVWSGCKVNPKHVVKDQERTNKRGISLEEQDCGLKKVDYERGRYCTYTSWITESEVQDGPCPECEMGIPARRSPGTEAKGGKLER
jgi:hypothetical protein